MNLFAKFVPEINTLKTIEKYSKEMLRSICLILAAISFQAPAFPNNPHIINIRREDYRASNKNWAIGKDERGVLYFGNDIGLLEFDGIEWFLNELPNKSAIRSVAVLSHQTLFTGSYEEFGRWDRNISGNLVYTSLSDKIDRSLFRNDDFWKIWIADSLVYFQSFTSIYVYDRQSIRKIPYDQSLLFLQKVRNEFLIQQMLGGICRFDGSDLQLIPGSECFKNTDVRVILPVGKTGYLMGTAEKGIYIYDGKTFADWNPSLSKILISNELNCGILTSQGLYYWGTISGGIFVTDAKGTVLNHISSENNLQNNTILSLLEDDSGNIWAALDRGISYINYMNNMSCYIDPGGNPGAVYSAALWNKTLYIATNQGVFYIDRDDLIRSNNLKHLQLINGTQGQVWHLEIVDGHFYCCHNKGLKEIHSNRSVSDIKDINTGVYNLAKIIFKGRDLLLLATYYSLKIMDMKTGNVIPIQQIPEPIHSVETDHLGNIWLEHANKGIYRCKLNSDASGFQNFTLYGGNNSDSLPYKLKMFKVGGRIELFGGDCFYTYSDTEDKIIPNKLLNQCFRNIKNIKQINAVGDNTFWALTDHSVYRFFYDGYSASVLENYDLGLDMMPVNRSENISILNDSTYLICLDNGFLLYNLSTQQSTDSDKKQSAPFIESLQVMTSSGESKYIDIINDKRISYQNNHLFFRFSAKDVFTDHLLFQYRLNGIDKDWSAPQKINRIAYARLPKGKYEFRVRTIDYQGNYSDDSVYGFEIMPPLYLSAWAFAGYLLLLAILFYAGRKMLLKRYRTKNLQNIKNRETQQLEVLTKKLQNEVDIKNAELLSQSSFIIQKNELIEKIKNTIDDFYSQNKNTSLMPLYQRINSLLNLNLNSEEDWNRFLIKFEEKHTGFFRNLKRRYPQLTNHDLRLCACLKLSMESKEIASLMNLSVRAVENSRYRLRKKLNLPPAQNLNEFFLEVD